MKLKIPEIGYLVEIDEAHVTSLMFEEPSLFARCVECIRMACEGQYDDAFLWDDTKSLSLSKNSEIIFYPSLIDFNSRKIQTALIRKLRQLNGIEIEKTNELEEQIKSLRIHFDKFMGDVDLDYTYCDTPDLSAVLKFLDISIAPEDCDICNRVKEYLHVCSALGLSEYLFCFNFKSIFTKDEIADIELCALQNGRKLVLLDHVSEACVSPYEKGIIITKEYDIAQLEGNHDSTLKYVFD